MGGAAEYPGQREKFQPEAVGHAPAGRAEYRRDRGAVQGKEPSAQAARGSEAGPGCPSRAGVHALAAGKTWSGAAAMETRWRGWSWQ